MKYNKRIRTLKEQKEFFENLRNQIETFISTSEIVTPAQKKVLADINENIYMISRRINTTQKKRDNDIEAIKNLIEYSYQKHDSALLYKTAKKYGYSKLAISNLFQLVKK